MKTLIIIFASIIAFSADINAQVNSHNLNIADFHSISCNSRYTVYLKQSNKEEVRVEAQKEIYEISEFIVKDGVLEINIKKEKSKDKSVLRQIEDIKILPTLNVYVSIKDVKALQVNGSGKIITENSIASDDLTISIAGSGEMEIDVKGKNINAKISGPGDLKLSGYANNLDLALSGSGEAEAYEFEVATASCKLYGAGSAQLNVSDELTAEIYGNGNIQVKGATKNVTKKIYGYGELERTY